MRIANPSPPRATGTAVPTAPVGSRAQNRPNPSRSRQTAWLHCSTPRAIGATGPHDCAGLNRPRSNCAGERKKRKREEGVQARAKAKRGEGPPLGAARPKGKNIVGLFWHTMHQPKEKKRNRRHGTYVALLHGNDSGRRKRSFAKAASPTRRHAPSSGSVAGERPRVSPRGQNQSTLRAPITPCHPYCAWAKGSIERHNRLVRTHHPKPTDFSKLSPHALNRPTTSSSTTPALPETP